jgi:REP element-mobilizing transposase RayT
MSQTLGFHLTKSTFGTWLPGDARGSWSEAWSPSQGFHGAHQFHEGDPRREAMARRRMKHPPVVLTAEMIDVIIEAITSCVERSQGGLIIVAAAIEPTHAHLLLTNTGRDIDITAKWLADQTTKAIHRQTAHQGPVWTKNPWCDHIDSQEHWENALLYIDDHNRRAGRGSRPYPFLAPIEI